jgi:hypothetical protein
MILKNVVKVLDGNNEIQLIITYYRQFFTGYDYCITDLQNSPVTSVDVERSFSA